MLFLKAVTGSIHEQIHLPYVGKRRFLADAKLDCLFVQLVQMPRRLSAG